MPRGIPKIKRKTAKTTMTKSRAAAKPTMAKRTATKRMPGRTKTKR